MKRLLLVLFVFLTCFALFAGTLSGDVVDEYYDECGYSSKRGQWKIGYYTDDFGDPTDEAYVYYLGKGTYTTDSSVSASTFTT